MSELAFSRRTARSYTDIAPLKDYIERVGADEVNFKLFIIRDHSQADVVCQERALIKINEDNGIECSDKEFEPTDLERKEIKEVLAKLEFPEPMLATDGDWETLINRRGPSAILYPFYDRKTGLIIMAQECDVINGAKANLSWTLWSDNQWRSMEPDLKLPLWKPKLPTHKRKVMVHEGAKTADFVHRLCNDPEMKKEFSEHPWGEELADYEHWGIIGGALAPQRTDYAELIREQPLEVIYVCDNDWPGKSALRLVSKSYGHSMKGIMFDERWNQAWNLADPMPENFYGADGRWRGPTLETLTQIATWATKIVSDPKSGKSKIVISPEFSREWVHAITPAVFVHVDKPSKSFLPQEFNNLTRPFSDVNDTAQLLRAEAANSAIGLEYTPALQSGIYVSSGERYMNTHTGTNIRPVKGNPVPWLDYTSHLIVDEKDRYELHKYCATLIACPAIKMSYGILLVSETQGCGKSTLGEKILSPLLGEWNVSYPSENDIVDNNFNYWCANKRLAVIHEIYAGRRSKAYNRLKSIITDKSVLINEKFQAPYQTENWLHMLACSNSLNALKLELDERRWFVPKVTTEKRTTEYWADFNDWLINRDGLGIIYQWALDWVKDHLPVRVGDAAPTSSFKTDVTDEGLSPGLSLVNDVLEALRDQMGGDRRLFVLDGQLVNLIRDVVYEGRNDFRLEKASQVRKLAASRGWLVGTTPVRIVEWGLQKQRIISLDPDVIAADPVQLKKCGQTPFDVVSFWKMNQG